MGGPPPSLQSQQPSQNTNIPAPSPTQSAQNDATQTSTIGAPAGSLSSPSTNSKTPAAHVAQNSQQLLQQQKQPSRHPVQGMMGPSISVAGTGAASRLNNNSVGAPAALVHNNATSQPQQQTQIHQQAMFPTPSFVGGGGIAQNRGQGQQPVMSIAVSSDVAKQLVQYANLGLIQQHQIPAFQQIPQQQLQQQQHPVQQQHVNSSSSGGATSAAPTMMTLPNGFQFHQNPQQQQQQQQTNAAFAQQLQALGFQRLQEIQRPSFVSAPAGGGVQQQTAALQPQQQQAVNSGNGGGSTSHKKRSHHTSSNSANEVSSSSTSGGRGRHGSSSSTPPDSEGSNQGDTSDAQPPAKNKFTIVPCRARGMPMEHNFQVSDGVEASFLSM